MLPQCSIRNCFLVRSLRGPLRMREVKSFLADENADLNPHKGDENANHYHSAFLKDLPSWIIKVEFLSQKISFEMLFVQFFYILLFFRNLLAVRFFFLGFQNFEEKHLLLFSLHPIFSKIFSTKTFVDFGDVVVDVDSFLRHSHEQ